MLSRFEPLPDAADLNWIWPNFSRPEMACRHCGEGYDWPAFMDCLQKARDIVHRPFHILSAHRCALHNARVGGAPLSQHLRLAADIALIVGLGLDAAAGGVFGIIGTVIGRVAGFFERRQSFKQAQARWAHELELHKLQMQARSQEADINALAHYGLDIFSDAKRFYRRSGSLRRNGRNTVVVWRSRAKAFDETRRQRLTGP